MTATKSVDEARAEFDAARASLLQLKGEISRTIIGHDEVVFGVLTCLVAGGHALLEGVPGLGKTMLVRTMAAALGVSFGRIQFTPDLMPADILGTTVITESESGRRSFEFRKGPVFANIVLADEINRATPKTQSALLEAMQEHRISIGRETFLLPPPFIVLATQNPLEMEGTYPLPEAQLDRFLLKLHVTFPTREELHEILDRTTGVEAPPARTVTDGDRIVAMQQLVRSIPVSRSVQDFAVRLLLATHPTSAEAPDLVRRFVRYGASPRGAQSMLLAAKVRALRDGRYAPSTDDVREVALPALRHRVLLNFEGEAEGVMTDDLVRAALASVSADASSTERRRGPL